MRKFLLAIVLFLGVMFVITRFAEVQAIADTLKRGDWRFLLLALGAEAVWIIIVAATYKVIYQAIGMEETVRRLLPVSAAAYFVNIVAPTAGMSGMAVFIAEARRRNYSTARATVAGALAVLFDYAAFLCVLALGLVVLIRRNNLNTYELMGTGVLLFISLVLAFLIYLGMRSGNELGRALAWMARQVNRVLRPFIKREYLSEQRAIDFAKDASGGLQELARDPKKLLLPFVLALSRQGLLILILALCFMAFDVEISIGTLIAGFSLGYLFVIVSPTPAGLGVVEGMLTLAISSMYVPIGAAAVITIAYRGFTFWIPLLVGIIAFRWLGGETTLAREL